MEPTEKPVFLYPKIETYSFDRVARDIVLALQERNFTVPDIKADLFDYIGKYEKDGKKPKYSMVGSIESEALDCRIFFSRIQDLDDYAGVTCITIPNYEIRIPQIIGMGRAIILYQYTGEDWSRWRTHFMSDDKECVSYLIYRAEFHGPPTYRDFFEYDRMSHEHLWGHYTDESSYGKLSPKYPAKYPADEIIWKFTDRLKNVLLPHILKQPA